SIVDRILFPYLYTAIRVDGPLHKGRGWLKLDEFRNFFDIAKELGEKRTFVFSANFVSNGEQESTHQDKLFIPSFLPEQVREQFVQFLSLNPNNGSDINTKRRRIYGEPERQSPIQNEAQITFNNSILMDNGSDYICPPFKELVRATMYSIFLYSNTSYFGEPVYILG
ncbi:hypothetical protein PHET_06381, partial [Paragonimus heterotremus]